MPAVTQMSKGVQVLDAARSLQLALSHVKSLKYEKKKHTKLLVEQTDGLSSSLPLVRCHCCPSNCWIFTSKAAWVRNGAPSSQRDGGTEAEGRKKIPLGGESREAHKGESSSKAREKKEQPPAGSEPSSPPKKTTTESPARLGSHLRGSCTSTENFFSRK